MSHETRIEAKGLTVEIAGKRLVEELTLNIEPGESLAILGCNGSGKSSLLHTLAGLNPATAGSVALSGRPLTQLKRIEVARTLGVLLQEQYDPFPISVFEAALTGRHPHLASWQDESDDDRAIARAALDEMGLAELMQRRVQTLSGGERRRLAIATLFTQQPPLMLLDEPTNHLDLRHQREVLAALERRVKAGTGVVMVLHDINQAARCCNRVLLLYGDGRWELGEREDMLVPERLTRLYGTPVGVTETPGGRLYYSG